MRPETMPYKVLAQLLYLKSPKVFEELEEGKLLVCTNRLAEAMGLQNARIKKYLQRLEVLGFISELKFIHGSCLLRLAVPVRGVE